jgi:hypothetical protein
MHFHPSGACVHQTRIHRLSVPVRRRLHGLLLAAVLAAVPACESFTGSQPEPAGPAPKQFHLVAAGTTQEELIRKNGLPDRREQQGNAEIWTYLIETEAALTTGIVELEGGVVTHSEGRFTFKIGPPPVPAPVPPPTP